MFSTGTSDTSVAATHGHSGLGLPVGVERLPGRDLQHKPVVFVAGHERGAAEPATGVGTERGGHQGAAGLRRSWQRREGTSGHGTTAAVWTC